MKLTDVEVLDLATRAGFGGQQRITLKYKLRQFAVLLAQKIGETVEEEVHDDAWLTPDEAAKLLNLRPDTLAVWRSTKARVIPYYKVGRSVRYKRCDVLEWLENQRK